MLAERYRAENPFGGAKRHFQSMSMGRGGLMNMNFGSCVTLGVDAQFLRLSLLLPFRPFHPPLAIPLADLAGERKKVFFIKTVRVSASREPEIRINLSERQARWVEKNSGGAWRMPAEPA